MVETIELEVGDLYAKLHEKYGEDLGEQYTDQMRRVFENQLHQLNQQLERAREQQEGGAVDPSVAELGSDAGDDGDVVGSI